MKILLFANDERTIYNFRREMIDSFYKNGFEVYTCYPHNKYTKEIERLGCKVINININRKGKNLFQDLKVIKDFIKILKAVNPDIVLTFTLKPNIYGGFVCQLMKYKYISNITGTEDPNEKSLLVWLIMKMQKISLKKADYIFFQNSNDILIFKDKHILNKKTNYGLIPGSGVNLTMQKFEPFPQNNENIRFISIARIRRDKGFYELFDAIVKIKKKYKNVAFLIVGDCEEKNLFNIIQELSKKGYITYYEEVKQEKIHNLLIDSNCLINPSYHEGMSNVLLEALATGRPVIASDIPGCREIFDEGISGYGCKVRDSESLFDAIEKMIKTPLNAQIQMGKNGRLKIEKKFDRNIVINAYLDEIKRIGM